MVTLIHSTDELLSLRAEEKGRVNFVPTMGNLHLGHISLLEAAFGSADIVYFSIFVNPKQFGPTEDFDKYPRTLDDDLAAIKKTAAKYPEKKVVVFVPVNPQEVFPPGYNQSVSVEGLNRILEGEFRPGHMDGVTTVVYRLFEIVRPTKAFFGLKDYQQYVIIKQMTRDLQLPISIVGMPIVRESSGLAMSSRNQYLSTAQKEEALVLNRTLKDISGILDRKKVNLPKVKEAIAKIKQDKRWNYLEVRDAESLSGDLTHSKKVSIVAVLQLGSIRLLDNLQTELE